MSNVSASNPPNQPVAAANTPTPVSQLPDAQHMQEQLAESGVLLASLQHVEKKPQLDTSPLAALQPNNMVQTQIGPQPMYLPSANQPQLEQSVLATTYQPASVEQAVSGYSLFFQKILKIGVAVGLAGQGLWGLYQALLFLLVDYPMLEASLLQHTIAQSQVNTLAINALISFAVTSFGFLFAVRIIRSKSASAFNTIVGVILFFFGSFITQTLSERLDVVALFENPVGEFQNSLDSAVTKTIEVVPVLEQDEANPSQPNFVWYE